MKNLSFFKRLGFAIVGMRAAWYRERSFRTQVLMGTSAIMVVLMMGASPQWLAIISITIAVVLAAELFNSSLEGLIDHLHPEIHQEIKVVKDIAAAGVLLVSIGAVTVGVLFLWAHV